MFYNTFQLVIITSFKPMFFATLRGLSPLMHFAQQSLNNIQQACREQKFGRKDVNSETIAWQTRLALRKFAKPPLLFEDFARRILWVLATNI